MIWPFETCTFMYFTYSWWKGRRVYNCWVHSIKGMRSLRRHFRWGLLESWLRFAWSEPCKEKLLPNKWRPSIGEGDGCILLESWTMSKLVYLLSCEMLLCFSHHWVNIFFLDVSALDKLKETVESEAHRKHTIGFKLSRMGKGRVTGRAKQ